MIDFQNTNPLDFFFMEEGLRHTQQLNFSLYSGYYCAAGCRICYLKDSWKPVHPFAPTKIHEQMLSDFDTVYLFDDLKWTAKHHPDTYDWYRAYADKMLSISMTDNSLLSQLPHVLKFDWKGLSQVSLTVPYYLQNKRRVLAALDKLTLHHGPLELLKVIVTSDTRDVKLDFPELKQFSESTSVGNEFGADIDPMTGKEFGQNISYHEKWDGRPFFLSDAAYFFGDRFYHDLTDSINQSNGYYDTAGGFRYADYISHSLEHKLNMYRDYADKLPPCAHKDYYSELSRRVSVNHDYTFIPYALLDAHKVKLERWGLVPVPQGWLRAPGAGKVVPIISISD